MADKGAEALRLLDRAAARAAKQAILANAATSKADEITSKASAAEVHRGAPGDPRLTATAKQAPKPKQQDLQQELENQKNRVKSLEHALAHSQNLVAEKEAETNRAVKIATRAEAQADETIKMAYTAAQREHILRQAAQSLHPGTVLAAVERAQAAADDQAAEAKGGGGKGKGGGGKGGGGSKAAGRGGSWKAKGGKKAPIDPEETRATSKGGKAYGPANQRWRETSGRYGDRSKSNKSPIQAYWCAFYGAKAQGPGYLAWWKERNPHPRDVVEATPAQQHSDAEQQGDAPEANDSAGSESVAANAPHLYRTAPF